MSTVEEPTSTPGPVTIGPSTISFAYCGVYNHAIAALAEGLKWQVLMPPPITAETVRLGTSYASEMICFPYKVTLGSIIQLAQMGVQNVLTYNTQGDCRYSHFHTLYRDVLKKLDLNCTVHTIDTGKLLGSFIRSTNGRFAPIKLIKGLLKARREMQMHERAQEARFAEPAVKVLIVGEAFSSLVPEINCDVRSRLLELGIGSVVPAAFSYYFDQKYSLTFHEPEHRQAKRLVSAPIGGCAFESLKNTMGAARRGFQGVIHLYPLTCMPETTVAQLLDTIAEEQKLPILHLEIDENVSRLNVHNRIEAFAEIVNMRARRG